MGIHEKNLAFWFSEDLVRLSWFVVCENVINGKIMKFCIEAILQLFFSTSKKNIFELEKNPKIFEDFQKMKKSSRLSGLHRGFKRPEVAKCRKM